MIGPSEARSYNVIGYLEGSDPYLKSQTIVYTAHYDAYGLEPDGRMFPGAGDDALEVGGMIAIADTLKNPSNRPRRSVMFMATTGEELGSLGAFYWVNHPTWPLKNVVADLNLDGVGSETWGPMKVFYAIGIQESNLSAMLERACQSFCLQVEADTLTAARLLQRSDTFVFAEHGIPFVYGIGLPKEMSEVGAKFGLWLNEITHYEGTKSGLIGIGRE